MAVNQTVLIGGTVPLPTGAATAAKQDTQTTALGTLATQATLAALPAALRVGAAHLASSQATCDNTADQLAAARPTRVRCTLVNVGSVVAFIGETTATTSMARLNPGSFITLTTPAVISGITAAGTANIDVWDEYD